MGPIHRKCLFVPNGSVSCLTGCVGVRMFSTVIIRTGMCMCMRVHLWALLLYLSPTAVRSKCRCSPGRKPLATEDEITVWPTRDFLPTQEVEAQLRGKGLFLCHPRSSCPRSSCVLLQDPCFVSEMKKSITRSSSLFSLTLN